MPAQEDASQDTQQQMPAEKPEPNIFGDGFEEFKKGA